MTKPVKRLSKDIVHALGGQPNIRQFTHCMTRLRVVLNDASKSDYNRLKDLDGVIGVVSNGEQCQVIVGNNVSAVYREIEQYLARESDTNKEITSSSKPANYSFKSIPSKMLDALVATMSPLIPAIIGASMIKLLAMILQVIGILESTSPIFTLLNIIADSAFFFLPLLVAASAAVKFNTNVSMSIAIAGVLVHPSFIELIRSGVYGEKLLIDLASFNYAYSILPALVMTWVLSLIERTAERATPDIVKSFLKPMIIMLIAAPLAIFLVGPLTLWIGNNILSLVFIVHEQLGWLAVALLGALWPLIILTGMHRVLTPVIIQSIAQTGSESLILTAQIGANVGMGGACLAVAWMTKNRAMKQTSLTASASAILSGVSELALYGVLTRLKRPLIATMITGFIVGAFAGFIGIESQSLAAPSLLTSVQFLDVNNPTSLGWVLGLVTLSIFISFSLTMILGFADIDEKKSSNTQQIEPDFSKSN
ncbi:PTS transporter subunit EIIC [Vibrio astriarenae]|uniref:PTS transporter subunit EIIC n=1 Tax=Vibrio astriarenae TaxID=1481923 RepID=UPI003734D404